MSRKPYRERGVARPLTPIKHKKAGKHTGRWVARFVDTDGRTRQIGIFVSKAKAARATGAAVEAANEKAQVLGDEAKSSGSSAVRDRPDLPLAAYADVDVYPGAGAMHAGTLRTAFERIRRTANYLPPASAGKPIFQLTTGDMHAALDAMRVKGLSRKTIDDAFAATSLLIRRLVERDFDVTDVAAGVKLPDRVHNYAPEPPREKRALPPDEVHAFSETLTESEQWVLWFYLATGARLAEGLVANANQRDAETSSIYLHETATRNGKLEPGLKTTHHVADFHERGRSTLFPSFLDEMSRPLSPAGYWILTPRGSFWSQRNFYRDFWGNTPGSAHKDGPMTRWERAGNERFTIDALRKTFSSWLAACGIPLWAIDVWTGHSDQRTLDSLGRGAPSDPFARGDQRHRILLKHYVRVMQPQRDLAIEVLEFIYREKRLPTVGLS